MAIVDELVSLLSLEEDPRNARTAGNFNKTMNQIGKQAALAAAAIAGLTAATGLWINRTANAIDTAGKFADQLGNLTFEELQELEFAIQRAGGTVEGLRSSLRNLISRSTGDFIGQVSQEFLRLGIQTRDSNGQLLPMVDILANIADRMQNLSKTDAFILGEKLGLSEGTIRLLQQGRGEVEALRKEARILGAIIPEGATKDAAEFVDAVGRTQNIIEKLYGTIVAELLPALTPVIEEFTKFIAANKELIKTQAVQFLKSVGQGFRNFYTIIRPILSIIGRLITSFTGLVESFGDVDVVAAAVTATLLTLTSVLGLFALTTIVNAIVSMGALIKSFGLWIITLRKALPVLRAAGISMAAVNLPFILGAAAVLALVAAIGLLAEDIYVFSQGGQSALGVLVDFFQNDFANLIANPLSGLGIDWNNFFSVQTLQAILNSIWESIKERFNSADLTVDWEVILPPLALAKQLTGLAGLIKKTLFDSANEGINEGVKSAGGAEVEGGDIRGGQETRSVFEIEANEFIEAMKRFFGILDSEAITLRSNVVRSAEATQGIREPERRTPILPGSNLQPQVLINQPAAENQTPVVQQIQGGDMTFNIREARSPRATANEIDRRLNQTGQQAISPGIIAPVVG